MTAIGFYTSQRGGRVPPGSDAMTATATATARRPSLKKAATKQADPEAAPAAPAVVPDTVEHLEAAIADARGRLKTVEDAGYRSAAQWEQRDADLAAGRSEVAGLAARLEAARVRELPAAAPIAATARFELRTIRIDQIVDTGNHREGDDEAAVERLARSLLTVGLQQPVGVRVAGVGAFERIFGSRRITAARRAGWTEIQAKVYPEDLTPLDVEILRTVENFGRKELTAVERAIAVARCLDQVAAALRPVEDTRKHVFVGGDREGPLVTIQALLDHAAGLGEQGDGVVHGRPALAAAIRLAVQIKAAGGVEAYVGLQLGYPRSWVKDHAYVSKLGGETRKLLSAGRLSLAHARELAKLGDPARADGIARSAAKNEDGTGGQSVETTARQVVDAMRSLKVVPWRLDVAFGREHPKCTGHACSACPFNSKADPDLFGGAMADEPAAGTCTHPTCFGAKESLTDAAAGRIVTKAKAYVKKNAGMAVTEGSLGGLVSQEAHYVKPAVVVRKVKRELEPPKTAAASGGGGGHTAHQTPEAIATGRLDAAMGKWESAATKAVDAALAKKPGRRLLFTLIKERLDLWEHAKAPYGNDPKAVARSVAAAKKADLRSALSALVSPDLRAFVALEDKLRDPVEVYDLSEMVPEATLVLADVLGVELDPPPTLEQFLREERAKADKAARRADGGKKPAAKQPAAKGKGALPPAPADDDLDEDDAGPGDDPEDE